MWCPNCQADVAAEVSRDHRRIICTACGQEMSGPLPGGDDPARDAQDLLKRWSQDELLDPTGRPQGPDRPDERSPRRLDSPSGADDRRGSETPPPGLQPRSPEPSEPPVDRPGPVFGSPFGQTGSTEPTPKEPTLPGPISSGPRSGDEFRSDHGSRSDQNLPSEQRGESASGRVRRPKFRIDPPHPGVPTAGGSGGSPSASDVPPPRRPYFADREDEPTGQPLGVGGGSPLEFRSDSGAAQTPPPPGPPAPPHAGDEPSRGPIPPRIDAAHGSIPAPHFDVQTLLETNTKKKPNWFSLLGQLLAYGGVGMLTVGTALVLGGYFGGPEEYMRTGWLTATVGQMLLFLGVVTLISSGMEQTSEEVSERVEILGRHILRIEHFSRVNQMSGQNTGESDEKAA